MSSIRAIISDADGTVINTVLLVHRGVYETARVYLTERGFPSGDIIPYDDVALFINRTVGLSFERMFEEVVTYMGKGSIPYDHAAFLPMLMNIQDKLAPTLVQAYGGFEDVLHYCGRNAMPFGILTTGSRMMVLRNFGIILPAAGCTGLYCDDAIPPGDRMATLEKRIAHAYELPAFAFVTSDDVEKIKPDPEGVFMLLDRLNAKAGYTLGLGDYPVDMEAYRKAGMRAIGINHGFGSEHDLMRSGAERILHSLTEVIPNLGESAIAAYPNPNPKKMPPRTGMYRP